MPSSNTFNKVLKNVLQKVINQKFFTINFLWVNFLASFSMDLNSTYNFAFFLSQLNILRKKNCGTNLALSGNFESKCAQDGS